MNRDILVVISPGHRINEAGLKTGAHDDFNEIDEYDLNTVYGAKLLSEFRDAGVEAAVTERELWRYRVPHVKSWMDEYDSQHGVYPAIFWLELHMNSAEDRRANGAEVFVSSSESKSVPLAAVILNSIVTVGGFRNRGIKECPYYPLTGAAWRAAGINNMELIYGTLIEFGFITSASDARKLKDEQIQNAICKNIVRDGVDWLLGTSIGKLRR